MVWLMPRLTLNIRILAPTIASSGPDFLVAMGGSQLFKLEPYHNLREPMILICDHRKHFYARLDTGVVYRQPAIRVDRRLHGRRAAGFEKLLQDGTVLLRKRKQPAHQFKESRFFRYIEQFAEFRAGILPQCRQKPFGLVIRIALRHAIQIVDNRFRTHFIPRYLAIAYRPSAPGRLSGS